MNAEKIEQYKGISLHFGMHNDKYPSLTVRDEKGKIFCKIHNYFYREVDREKAAIEAKEIYDRMEEQKKEKAKEKEELKAIGNPFKVGDIFYHSWGYDQTNIDFYQVIEVKKMSVVIQRIAGHDVTPEEWGGSSMAGQITACKDEFITSGYACEPLTKRVMSYMTAGKPYYYLNMKYGSCSLWDGTPKYYSWYA